MKQAGILLIIVIALGVQSCTFANRSKSNIAPDVHETIYEPGKGDAYLFDVKIHREGKRNSVRLDLYKIGDTISMFARGYLGKGVMKGLIFSDSALIFFPTTKEYYNGPLSSLIGDKCAEGINFETAMIMMFQQTPSEIETGLEDFFINIQSESKSSRKYRLTSKNCGHSINMEYRLKDKRFVPYKFDFLIEPDDETADIFKFSAKRRQYRSNVSIPEKKMKIDIPIDAVRINL